LKEQDRVEYPKSSAANYCGLPSYDILVRKDELLAEIDDRQEFLGTDTEMSLLPEERNPSGRRHLVPMIFMTHPV